MPLEIPFLGGGIAYLNSLGGSAVPVLGEVQQIITQLPSSVLGCNDFQARGITHLDIDLFSNSGRSLAFKRIGKKKDAY